MFTVHIRKNETYETRQWVVKDEDWCAVTDYLWTEGNYACDCNRALFFAWAKGEEPKEGECGETAYSIRFIELEDGSKLKIE